MLTLIGLLTICSLVVLLLVGRMAPILPLILVPLAGALLAGFGLEAITGFFTDGLGKVISIATMFVFAITFFGVLQDTGLFRPIIGTMVRLTRANVALAWFCWWPSPSCLVGGSRGVSPQGLAVRMPAYWSKATTAFTNPPKKSAPWSGRADSGSTAGCSWWC